MKKSTLLFIFTLFINLINAQDAFITRWKTDNAGSSADTFITIPTYSGETYHYDIDWDNDGTFDQLGITGDITHDFGTAGTYTIRIRGDFPRIYFNNTGDRSKLLSVLQWGNIAWSSMEHAFDGCENMHIQAQDAPDLSGVTDMGYTFARCSVMNEDIEHWDTSQITNMSHLFYNSPGFNQNLGNWDTGQVTNMSYMFVNAVSFDRDISNWQVGNVVTMYKMFQGVKLSTTNYDNLLIAWDAQMVQADVNFNGGNSEYCIAGTERAHLISADGWTISDGGENCTPFITTWKTDNSGTSSDTSITIPTFSGETYNYDVDWDNDGTFDEFGITGDASHDFGTAGTYTIRIQGDFPRIYFNSISLDNDKLLSVDQWGDITWHSMELAFFHCDNLHINATDAPNLTYVTDMSRMFNHCLSMNENIEHWDTKHITNMSGMFSGASVFNQPIGEWETGLVTDMSAMFNNAFVFNQPIGEWDTGLVTDMSYMFYNASAFNQQIGEWETEQVTNMSGMFRGASTFNQPIGEWETGLVTDISYMFYNASDFNQPIGEWETGLVTDMSYMFYNASDFNQPIGEWETGIVTDMSYMFYNASAFNQSIGEWETEQVTNMSDMFRGASAFNQPIGEWNTGIVTDMSYMFAGASVFNQPIGEWETGEVTNMSFMFYYASVFNQPIGEWDTSKVLNMYYLFYRASNFNQFIGNWNTTQVRYMSNMFNYATLFNQDIGNWDTHNVTTMAYMFSHANSFDQDISNWDITNVRYMSHMFFNVKLSTTHYDNLLISWDAQSVQSGVNFHGGRSEYCVAEAERSHLISADDWEIIDDGNHCDSCTGTLTFWDGSSWSSGTPDSNTPVRIQGNYDTQVNGNLQACNCTIDSNQVVTVREADNIHVKYLNNNGLIIVENNASLLQSENDATVDGKGSYEIHRITPEYADYDYIFWASPTDASSFEHVLADSPQNYIFSYNTANFMDLYDDATYPQTTGSSDTYDDDANVWARVNGTDIMETGKGYIAMGAGSDFPFDFVNIETDNTQHVIFDQGKVNNAEISVPVSLDAYNEAGYNIDATTNSYHTNANLLGNPYPSAIDVVAFRTDPDNTDILQGTFYIWTHDTAVAQGTGPDAWGYTADDYAIMSVDEDGNFSEVAAGNGNGTHASRYIASGQGFEADITANGNVFFKNSMRSENNNDFFRRQNNNTTTERDQFWLNLKQTANPFFFRQLNIGFYATATDGYKDGQDAARVQNGNHADFYSIIPGDVRQFAIQNLSTFETSKIIPLGVEAYNAGEYSIKIDRTAGVFAMNQEIFLLDQKTNTYHNLTTDDYVFSIENFELGNLNDRFEIHFFNPQVSAIDNNSLEQLSIYPNPSTGIYFIGLNNVSYEVYDTAGILLLKGKEIKNNRIDLSRYRNGIYILKLQTEGIEKSFKLIKK